MIAMPHKSPEFDSSLCTINEFLESLNPVYAKTMHPDLKDNRPIWQYNIEEKRVFNRTYGQTSRCIIKQIIRGKKSYFSPIFKTPNGCIMEDVNLPYTTRFNKICRAGSDCPLMPDLVVGVIRHNRHFNYEDEAEDEDFGEDGDFDDDEDFLQEPDARLIFTETPITAPLIPFLSDCCVKGGEVDNSILKAQYKQWCIENSKEEISPKKFKMIMKTLGFAQKNNPERTWENIQLSLKNRAGEF